ncbi:HesB/YadR/YfhF family protein [Paenibacillus gorillae]|uniref:HesB/YadR/YfhF family protein n=1 Tax=Paenibacillus gorillae TaxID=1243662 RepID=UPI0004B5CC15|nr:Fe-S cluster assembly protein HesB [Paenibacillus gorillae]
MKMSVTSAATACFMEEWGFKPEDSVRIYVRYSGGGEDAFSFGIMKDTARYPAVSTVQDGIHFYMEENDAWYMDGKDLTIDLRNENIVFVK